MTKKMKTFIGVSVVSLTLAITAMAFAHGGGYGRHMGGYGNCMMGNGPNMRGYSAWGDLSEETRTKVDAAREAFYKETHQLRGELDDARIALRDEMRKDNPDEGKVVELQKKLSGLQAEFDEKAVSHRLEMRKLVPEDARGRGYGRGHGRGYGRGPGGCW